MDIDLRLLRYFIAVAEELNFTQAAEQLYVSQPALSKQIRQLERELGIHLIRRTSRMVELTSAGQALLPLAKRLLYDWQFTLLTVREVATSETQTLRVGFVASIGSELTKTIIERFRERRVGWQVSMRMFPWADTTAGLLSGNTDVALLRLPVLERGQLSTEILWVEPRWVALHCQHPLTQRQIIQMADLVDEPFVALPAEAGAYRDYWLAIAERGGHPVRIGAEASNPDEWLEAIATGLGVGLVPEITTRVYQRAGIVFRLVDDISPSTLAVAWRRDSSSSAVQDFVQACLDARTQHLKMSTAD